MWAVSPRLAVGVRVQARAPYDPLALALSHAGAADASGPGRAQLNEAMHLLWNLQLPTRPPPCHICKHHPNLVVDATSAGVKSSQMPAAPLPVAPAPVLGGIPDSTDRNTNAGEGARGILALFKKWEAHGTTTPTGAAVSMSLADATSLIALVNARFTANVPLCESMESLLVGPGDVVQRIPPALRPLLQAVFRQTSFLPHVM